MKIGIMGGTFDPIHNGHLMLGNTAYEAFDLDEVWFMPNGNPPHKKSSTIEADVEDRVRMVDLAIREVPYFRQELYEAERKEVSCSYQTMEHFHNTRPEDSFYFIIGADSLFAIDSWVHPERIFPNCTVLATYRDEMNSKRKMESRIEELRERFHADIRLMSTPLLRISSHELRSMIKEGKKVDAYLPKAVSEYITHKNLYC